MKTFKTIIIVFAIIIISCILYVVLGQTPIENHASIATFSDSFVSSGDNEIKIILEKQTYEYTGKEIIPDIKIVQSGKELEKANYNIKAENNKMIGTANIIVFDNKDKRIAETTFDIVPRHTTISKDFSCTESTIELHWDKIEEADSYILYRFNNQKNKWERVFCSENEAQTEYIDSSLESGTKYHYLIRTTKRTNQKEYISELPKEYIAVTLPQKVSGLSYDEKSSTLKWQNDDKCEGYEIFVLDNNGKQSTLGTTNKPLYTLTKEDKSQGNAFKVRSFITLGNKKYFSSYSDVSEIEALDDNTNQTNKKVISVNSILQNPELPTGCEITALTILLNHYNFNVDKVTMAREFLPKFDFYTKNGVYYGADFKTTFPGDPERYYNSYGCYSDCIKTAADSYLNSVGSNYHAQNNTGEKLEDLLHNYIDHDIPVLIWITSDNLHESILTDTWTTPNGDTVQWLAYEHCVVLTGYDKNAGLIYVSDPLVGNTSYNRSLLEKRYIELGQQSLVISQ